MLMEGMGGVNAVWRAINPVTFSSQEEDGIGYSSVTGVQTCVFLISSRRRHTRFKCDWSSDVCSSDLKEEDGIRDSSVTGVQTCALPIFVKPGQGVLQQVAASKDSPVAPR